VYVNVDRTKDNEADRGSGDDFDIEPDTITLTLGCRKVDSRADGEPGGEESGEEIDV